MGFNSGFKGLKHIHFGIRAEFENCALLGYYEASSGNFLPTFRDNLSVSSSESRILLAAFRDKLSASYSGGKNPFEFLTPKDRTNRLSRNSSKRSLHPEGGTGKLCRNVGTKLTLPAA